MEPTSDLEDATVLITGASAGIGRATAERFGAVGANVALAARRRERLETVAKRIEEGDSSALVLPTDVTDEAAVTSMVERTVAHFGGLDVLVNNAGTGAATGDPIEEIETEAYRQVMGVNTDGMFFATRAAAPHLKASEGTLIFVASFAGQYPRPSMPVYAASKWWTRGFAHSLAGQLGRDGVAVSVINPTEVRTRFGKDFREDEELLAERYGPGEVTEPEAIAEAIVFAAGQQLPNAVAELDLYRRDKVSHF